MFFFSHSLSSFFLKPKHPFQETVLAILQIENVFKFVFKATFDEYKVVMELKQACNKYLKLSLIVNTAQLAQAINVLRCKQGLFR